MKEQFCWSI